MSPAALGMLLLSQYADRVGVHGQPVIVAIHRISSVRAEWRRDRYGSEQIVSIITMDNNEKLEVNQPPVTIQNMILERQKVLAQNRPIALTQDPSCADSTPKK